MIEWILFFLIHGAYWCAGILLISASIPGSHLFERGSPHWFSAWAIGLVPNVVTAFVANQFLGIPVTLPMLLFIACSIAGMSAGFRWLSRRRDVLHTNLSDDSSVTSSPCWTWGNVFLGCLAGLVWATRHAIIGPLWDWDSFMYHLPFGRLISEGSFPSELGRSYILQMEASYPPLFYFLYGLNGFLREPDVTYLAPQIQVAIINGLTCLAIWHAARRVAGLSNGWALLTVLGTACALNPVPNVQSVTALYFTLALVYSQDAFDRGQPSSQHRAFFLAAILWSGCYWNSYLGLPLLGLFFLGLLISHVWCVMRGDESSLDIRRYALAVLVVGIAIVPHLIRNWFAIGNPIYPAMPHLLGGADMTKWFLTHRPPAAAPMNHDIWFLPESLMLGRPRIHVLLAGISALLGTTHLPRGMRITAGTVLIGFFVIWFKVFHLENTLLFRYLTPVIPLSMVVIVGYLSEPWRAISLQHDTSGGHVSLLRYVRNTWKQCIPAFFVRSLWMLGYLLLLDADLIPVPVVFALLAALLVGPVFFSVRVAAVASSAQTTLSPRWRAAIPVAVAVTFFVAGSNWQEGNQPQLNVQPDITWMNENLSNDDLVAVFDGRLFTFRHRFLPLDGIRLEPFDKADNKSAIDELKKAGVTHFYYCADSANLLSPTMVEKIRSVLLPTSKNANVDLVYSSRTGWVVRLKETK